MPIKSSVDLRAMLHIKPKRDDKGNYVFAIGNHRIATFPPRYEGWLKAVGMLKW